MADDIKVVADYTDLQLMRRELVGVAKDAKTSASVFEREFNKVERQLAKQKKEFDANVKASQNFYNQLLGVSKSTKDAASSAAIFERELKKVEAATERATVAQQRFENTSRKGMRRVEVIAQQTGYQLGDLAVQIQGGTNAAVAFGQQGSQLLGFFGPAGALAGAALAITTAFVAPFMRAKNEAINLEKEIKALQDRLLELKGKDPLPENFNKALSKREDLQIKLIGLENDLAVKKGVVQQYEDAGITSGHMYLAAKGEQLRIEEQIFGIRKEDAELAKQIQDYEKARQEILQKITDDEAASIRRDLELFRVKSQFGKDSVQAKNAERDIALEIYEEDLKRLKLSDDQIKSLVGMKKIYLEFIEQQKELNDEAEKLGERLGVGFERALEIIRQAKAEATIDLSEFGGAGSFKYSTPSVFNKLKTSTGGSKAETQEEYLAKLTRELEMKKQTIFLSNEERKAQEQEFAIREKLKTLKGSVTEQEIQAVLKLQEEYSKLSSQKELMTAVAGHIENAFMAMVDGSKSVEDAFKAMIRNILLEIYREKVVKSFLSFFGFANGGVFKNGNVTAFAGGGVVGSPTYFPMSGGKTGLMGEAGPEAIMPLKRGPNGKLGVVAEGGSGAVNIVQHFNFSANGDESVKRIIKQQLPDITNATKAAVADSKRRGGAYGRAFN